jgi:tRNA uridine 5-carbamoylmethylation protein Kti12
MPKGKLLILTGLPASGKTTVARILAQGDAKICVVSSDELRASGGSSRVWERMREMVVEGLDQGRTVIVDATNYSSSHRRRFISAAEEAGVPYLVAFMSASLGTLHDRNLAREDRIPSRAIMHLSRLFEEPDDENTVRIDTEAVPPAAAARAIGGRLDSMSRQEALG